MKSIVPAKSPSSLLVALVACTLYTLLAPSSVVAQNYPGQDLRDLLAAQKDSPEIVVPPGTYDFTDQDPGNMATHLLINGHRNQVIKANDVVINATLCDQIISIVRVHACEDVTIEGLALDCDPLVGTQGTIVSVYNSYRTIDVAIDDGYRTDIFSSGHQDSPPLRPPKVYTPDGSDYVLGCASFNVDNSQGIVHKGGNASLWQIGVAQVGMTCLAPGQKVALVATTFHGMWVTSSKEVRFDGTRVWGAGAMGFAMSSGYGNHSLSNVRVERRPESGRLWSSNRDGVHNSEMYRGAHVEDSYFGWTVDDGHNQHGFYGRVIVDAVNSNSFIYVGHSAAHNPKGLMDSQPNGFGIAELQYYIQNGTTGELLHNVTATSAASATVAQALLDNALAVGWCGAGIANCKAWQVTVPDLVTVSVGDAVISQDVSCRGGSVRRTYFDHCDGRCVLVQWPFSVTEENVCVSPMHSGIVVNGQIFETGPVENTLVRRNVIINAGMKNIAPGGGWSVVGNGHGIQSQFDPPANDLGFTNFAWMNRDMRVESNNISAPLNTGIYVYTADGASLVDNRVCALGTREGPFGDVPQDAVVIGGTIASPAIQGVQQSGTTTETERCDEYDLDLSASDQSSDTTDGDGDAAERLSWWFNP